MTAPTVTEGEYVRPGGSTTVRWSVQLRDGWVDVARHPEVAEAPERGSPAGTVWERTWVLSVPPGTRLVRTETRPDRGRRLDPLDFLTRPVGAPVRTLRTEFEVTADGALRRREPGAR